MAIVVAFAVSLPILASLDLIAIQALYGLMMGSVSLVAVIGFSDDHGHIDARWRLLGHFTGRLGIVLVTGPWGNSAVYATVDLGWIGNILAAFYLSGALISVTWCRWD